MSVYIIEPSNPVNVVDTMGTTGDPLNAYTGLVPVGTPETAMVGTVSWAVASTADGDFDTETVTVTGARVGDRVSVNIMPPLNQWTAFGYVSATDTVIVQAQNKSGVTGTPGTVAVLVAVLPQLQINRLDGEF